MQSQKTFANHLADEEAMLAQEGQQGGRGEVVRVWRAPGLGKRASTAAMSPPAEDERRAIPKSQSTVEPPVVQPDPESEHLLKTYIPAAPSEAEMEALTSAPPLSYNQARAAPSVGKPQRFFCEICGYWGSIRCMKCGARVCGLECKGAHEEGRCLRY
jgi:zinc finger HIT domain-containing protein 1